MGDRSWLREQPEPIVAQAMATEGGIERRRAAVSGDVDGTHPLSCRCSRCVREDYDPADAR